jgi:hypothetical protein
MLRAIAIAVLLSLGITIPPLAIHTMAQEPAVDSPLPPPTFVERVHGLIEWISKHSPYPYTEDLPSFVFVSSETINYMSMGLNYTYGVGRTVALYIPAGDGIMVLPNDTSFTDDVLVHELIHHLQYHYGKSFRGCPGHLEAEAYAIQNQFIDETGIGVKSHPFTVWFASTCPNPWE